MTTTAMPYRWAARCHWALRAGFAGAATFTGTFVSLFAFVLALGGPDRLQQPVFFGLAGPSVASALMRPGLVIAGTVAVVAVVIYGLMRGDSHSATAPIVVAGGPLDFRGLRDWPNVRFDKPGVADVERGDDPTDKPANTPERARPTDEQRR
ncbi:hypothetical protein AB4Z39_05210 [Mycobacterium adipatum]|uniref:hypothetical protein n=1 Tax=Mycobacterium adipatum TaxID=1682113 RepID=UPI0034E07AE3